MLTRLATHAPRVLAGSLLTAAMFVACAAPSRAERDATPPASGAATVQTKDPKVIDHIRPRRDSVGPLPDRFEWTAAPAADSYTIGLWDDVDRLRWRQEGIKETSIARPEDVDLEAGTYFWMVVALRGGQQIAESGRSAFLVER
jgi:hypothetical protein